MILLLAPAAAGATPLSQACGADISEACAKAAPGPERWRCLEARKDKLSPDCRKRLSEMRDDGDAFRRDCGAEIGGACLGLQRRALVECLESQGNKLSPACSQRLSKLRAQRTSRRERISASCVRDAQKLCAEAPAGGIAACLRRSAGRVSRSCRGELAAERPQ